MSPSSNTANAFCDNLRCRGEETLDDVVDGDDGIEYLLLLLVERRERAKLAIASVTDFLPEDLELVVLLLCLILLELPLFFDDDLRRRDDRPEFIPRSRAGMVIILFM